MFPINDQLEQKTQLRMQVPLYEIVIFFNSFKLIPDFDMEFSLEGKCL